MTSRSPYHRPADLADVLDVLSDSAGDPNSGNAGGSAGGARLLVGGTDLLVGIRHRTVRPDVLVDLKTASDLPDAIAVGDDGVRLGPTATMAAIARHPQIREWYPGLVESALVVGSVAIRNRATLIGNICNASPACDTAPVLLALGARVTIVSRAGERTVALRDFFLGPRSTLCAADEVVVGVHVPAPTAGASSALQRLTRRRGVDLASVSVAASVGPRGETVLGLGAVGPRPLVAEIARPLDPSDEPAVMAAIEEAVQVATPISDVRAGREYRLAMVRVLARRAVVAAAARRSGEVGR